MNKRFIDILPYFLIFILSFFIMFMIINGNNKNIKIFNQNNKIENKKEEPKKTPEQLEKEKHDNWVESQFSKWDGSHRGLVKLVKQNLNDPKSFEHVETKFIRDGKDLIIVMKYRAKNVFGGLVLNGIKAKASYRDNTIRIIEQF
ncbi:hypothetical protein B2H94_09100 [Clostridium sporogenes]|uniref:Uncharacterized protein n=1 Tax=Clostridium sporogenes TaxID=1509 RepID=A0ABD6RXB7_CLOSG|nr:hypothetical protein [Clostridium sporogenes]OSB19238.1 hypothetical protein B2H94_09100 [Clostridium sporogenes]